MASAPSVWSNKRQGAIIDVQLGASLMNTRLIRFALGIAGILSLGTPVCAQAADEAKQLELRYRGVPSRVRDLVSDSKIRYDTRGKLIGKWHPGQWTWHSTVQVTNVEAKGMFLRIKANRLLLNYNRGTHKFAALTTMQTLEIEIETSPRTDGKVNVDGEWNKAFLMPDEKYPLDMQPYWEPFIACLINSKTEECEYYEKKAWEPDVYDINPTSDWKPSYPGVYTVGNDVTPPKVRSRVQPQYTDVARIAKVEGTVLLEAVVTKGGAIRILRIIRPLGFGLEENAAEGLSKWTFQPATRMGQPVDVLLGIEVNFNLRK